MPATVCHQQVDNTPNPKCHVLRKILEKSQKSNFGKSVLRDYWELGVHISRGIALSDKFLENKKIIDELFFFDDQKNIFRKKVGKIFEKSQNFIHGFSLIFKGKF